jgi:lysophospholipase L1-like esterase
VSKAGRTILYRFMLLKKTFPAALLLISLAITHGFAATKNESWIVTWGASPAPQESDEAKRQQEKLEFHAQTIREIIHTSAGSNVVRVRLSNAFGKDTVEIGAAHIGLSGEKSAIVAGTDHPLTFGGRASVSIPPNALVLSDPVNMNVPALANLSISLFIPQSALAGGIHYGAEQTSYVAPGDQTAAPELTSPETVTWWTFLTGVDVMAPKKGRTLVAFGDSITDGARSQTDANHRWPNFLAERLQRRLGEVGVLNAGIGGNRLLHDAVTNIGFGVNALARYDRDVLVQPGVKYVIVLEGINDLGHPGTSAPASETVRAEDLIGALKQLIARAHEKGIKIYGGTLTPFEGTIYPGYYSPEKEEKRKAVNEWIRTGDAFDGVIDFDKAVQDPSHPARMAAQFDSGDHLHPNDAGYKAMAAAIDLSFFK